MSKQRHILGKTGLLEEASSHVGKRNYRQRIKQQKYVNIFIRQVKWKQIDQANRATRHKQRFDQIKNHICHYISRFWHSWYHLLVPKVHFFLSHDQVNSRSRDHSKCHTYHEYDENSRQCPALLDRISCSRERTVCHFESNISACGRLNNTLIYSLRKNRSRITLRHIDYTSNSKLFGLIIGLVDKIWAITRFFTVICIVSELYEGFSALVAGIWAREILSIVDIRDWQVSEDIGRG